MEEALPQIVIRRIFQIKKKKSLESLRSHQGLLEYLRGPLGVLFCNRVLGLIPYCVKLKVKSNGSLVFLFVPKWQIYIDTSFTCTKMSKQSDLQHQLPKPPRRVDTRGD